MYKPKTAADKLIEQMTVGKRYMNHHLPPLAREAGISDDERAIVHHVHKLYKQGKIERHHDVSYIEWERVS